MFVIGVNATDRNAPSALFNVIVSLTAALCVPPAVVADALNVQVPLFSEGTPVVVLKAAVLKLIVTGEAAASAALCACTAALIVSVSANDFVPQVSVPMTFFST